MGACGLQVRFSLTRQAKLKFSQREDEMNLRNLVFSDERTHSGWDVRLTLLKTHKPEVRQCRAEVGCRKSGPINERRPILYGGV